MAETIYRGPAVSIGALMGNVTPQTGAQVAIVEPTDGPGIEYQANCFPDVRFGPFNKDGMQPGRLPAFLNSPYLVCADGIPSTLSTTSIAAGQAVTAATPMTLVTVAPGAGGTNVLSSNPAIPLVRGDTGAVVTAFGLDCGFATGNITAGSATVTVVDSTAFYVGQWIVIGGAGNSGKTASLITQVTALASATTITISPASAGTLTNAPISSGNAYSSQAGTFPFGAVATGAQPYSFAGVARIFNPLEAVCRAVNITGNAGSTAQNFTVRGYDVFGFPMTEVIAFAGGAVTTAGKKAFKYVASVTPASTDGGHSLSVGTTDVYGINLRSDKWEYMQVFWAGAFVTTSTGWVQALQPFNGPSSGTTADTRGTYATQSASNNSNRLSMQMTVPLYNLINATPNSAQAMFGLAQFAG